MLKRLLLLAVLAPAIYHAWHQARSPDITTTALAVPTFEFSPTLSPRLDPIQQDARGVTPFRFEHYLLTPVAKFQVAGRVLGVRQYSGDREADLAPVDLAMGWGPMANTGVLQSIDISQGGRFYRWHVDRFPIPKQDIVRHSANMHMVPANAEVVRQLRDVARGQTVRFKGYLLKIQADDGWHWRSSMTRNDQGAGACEVVLVDTIETI